MISLNINLPEKFLCGETLCDFDVSEKMKKVWAVELDLLKQFQDVCRKHNIKYFASGGTLLGAVRHKGFIPWDDDIDIAMPRKDFEKLCSLSNEFKSPYELQFYGKTKGYFTGHAQLRNTNTTAILREWLNLLLFYPYNHGIFIDIFPLDAVPDDPQKRREQISNILKYKKTARKLYNCTEGYNPEKASVKQKLVYYIWKIFPFAVSYDFYYQKFIRECRKYNNTETSFVSMLSFMPDNKKLWIKSCNINDIIDMDFEFMTICAEKNYDDVLKVQYGDYMKFVKGGCYHGGVIFDTDMPYSEWLRKHRKKKQS